MEHEILRLRRPEGSIAAEAESRGRPWTGRVVTTDPAKLKADRFISLQPFAVTGAEAEGGSPTLTDVGDPRLVVWIGPADPATGDKVIAKWVSHRWVARKRGGTGGTHPTGVNISGCLCANVPTTLHLSSPPSMASPCFGSDTFVWGPTPAEVSGIGLGDYCFLGTTTYTDSYSHAPYRYHLGCDSNWWRLSIVYFPSAYNDAWHDGTLYSWPIGSGGNTCSYTEHPSDPFFLAYGIIWPGGDTTCHPVVSE